MTKWTVEHARETLHQNGLKIVSEDRLSNDLGFQIKCVEGEIICIYDTGKLTVQGKNQGKLKAIFGQGNAFPGSASPADLSNQNSVNRNIFVVYGHDSAAKTELEAMLRRWGLNPLILDQLTSSGQTIIEKLERVRGDAAFAVILATPDDEGHRAGHPEEKAHRARQNVVLELGMMLSVLSRDRVAILMKDQVSMERPSDIQGLIYIPFKDEVREAALTLAKEINSKGIFIDLQKV